MRKSTLNAVIDALMFSTMVGVLCTGLLLWLVIGRGSDPEGLQFLWGLHRHAWREAHLIFSVSLVVLVVLHLLTHTTWLSGVSRHLLGIPGWAAVVLALLLGIVFFVAVLAWEAGFGPTGEGQRPRHRRGPPAFRGRQSDTTTSY